ncbi:zinc-binding dehydrogenase [Nocardia sp. NPDC020380]|uniref:zinc-binding dehydrogenase n=1 Tax=Nocardia sp. NPDC020380 TaxID=3364309 RepID=UPI0037B9FF93
MKAIVQREFGAPAELQLTDVPDPHAGAGEVRIRVESAGIHLLDTTVRRGAGSPNMRPELPVTPGREVAGIVDEVGDSVDAALLGQLVVADLAATGGGYAELAVASAQTVHAIPEGVTADQAVAMVGTGATTMAILELAQPKSEDVVVVTAAAGGIGTLLVQMLRAVGATVVGVAGGPDKISMVRELGSAAVDYHQPDWPQTVREAVDKRPITLVLDGVGGEIGRSALELLGVGGRLVMFGSASGELTPLSAADIYARGITVSAAIGARTFAPPLHPFQTRALQAAATGQITPIIGQRFALSDAPAAHIAVETRATIGKTVLRPDLATQSPRNPS